MNSELPRMSIDRRRLHPVRQSDSSQQKIGNRFNELTEPIASLGPVSSMKEAVACQVQRDAGHRQVNRTCFILLLENYLIYN